MAPMPNGRGGGGLVGSDLRRWAYRRSYATWRMISPGGAAPGPYSGTVLACSSGCVTRRP